MERLFHCNQIASAMMHNYLVELRGMESNEILSYISEFGEPHPEELFYPPEGKSDFASTAMMYEGDDHYMQGEWRMALEKYNYSILSALHPIVNDRSAYQDGNERDEFDFPITDPAQYGGVDKKQCRALPMAFASRSAILLNAQQYLKCLEDIDLAIEYDCPERLHHMLDQRKCECIARLQEKSSSTLWHFDLFYEKTVLAYETHKSTQPQDSYEMRALKNLFAPKPQRSKPLLRSANPNIPSLSSAIKVIGTIPNSRRVIATRNILPGEVLGEERAYACSILTLDKIICSTCLCETMTPLPCPGCTEVMFCSKKCRARGLAEDHWLECKLFTPVDEEENTSLILAFKMLKNFAYWQYEKLLGKLMVDLFMRPRQILGFNKDDLYKSTSFLSVYYLHHDKKPWAMSTLFYNCLSSYRVAKMLELSGRFYVNSSGEPITPTEGQLIHTSKFILHNIAKEMNNSLPCGDRKIKCRGIFPAISLFNRSNNPSAVYTYSGRVGKVHSLVPIAEGQEITLSIAKRPYNDGK